MPITTERLETHHMKEKRTLEVKVWDHHDAVVFVTQQRYEKTGEKTEAGHDKYNHWKEVLTAIPVDFGYNAELDDEEKYKLVKNVADLVCLTTSTTTSLLTDKIDE